MVQSHFQISKSMRQKMLRMKAFLCCALILVLGGMVSATASADEQDKGGRSREALIKKYDKNGDGQLDEQEKEAAKKELQGKRGDAGAGNKRELLKKYDKNGDGKLDEQEREAAQKELGNNAAGKGKPGAGRLGNLESNP